MRSCFFHGVHLSLLHQITNRMALVSACQQVSLTHLPSNIRRLQCLCHLHISLASFLSQPDESGAASAMIGPYEGPLIICMPASSLLTRRNPAYTPRPHSL